MVKKYDIFISHSKEDYKLALALCHFLEERQFRCWIAPRDVQAGKDYATCIIEGIQSSKIMIVIFSEYSNRSKHVRSEVERAFNHQVAILPFRIKDIIPEQSLEYFLSSYHWLDAIEGQAENYFDDLYRHCFALLRADQPAPPPFDDKKKERRYDDKRNDDDRKKKKAEPPPNRTAIYIAGGVILILLLFFIVIKPMFDKNTIEFKNNSPTNILIDLDGKTDTIHTNSSFIYSGRSKSRVKTTAYSYTYNSKGDVFGLKMQWYIDTAVHADGNYIYNLNVSNKYFFLRINNSSGYNINYLAVNSLSPTDKIVSRAPIPSTGSAFDLGYYKIMPDTRIEIWNTNNFNLFWANGNNIHFNENVNQTFTLSFK